MANDYNTIARFYDPLSRVVFQKSIVKAQQYLIDFIADNNTILVAGGGTGWILEEISKLKRQHISIAYVEKSSAMINLSKQKNYKNLHVDFVNEAIENYNSSETFDVIITPFLFDNFLEEKINVLFAKLDSLLHKNGLWLYADFVNKTDNKLWQKFLLKTMYLFFKLTAKIETQQLIDMRPYFKKYDVLSQQFYYRNFIQAIVYRKIS